MGRFLPKDTIKTPDCWMLDTGYLILDAGYWMLDTGFLMLDARSWINLKPET
jgi:hypothetical protein